MDPLTILSLVILGLLIARNVAGHPFQLFRLLLAPIIVGILGSVAILPLLPHTSLHAIDYIIGGLDLLDSLIVGGIRGFTVKLYEQNGRLHYRYTTATVLLWGASIVIRIVLSAIAVAHHATTLIAAADVLLMLALGVLFQNMVVIWRGKQQLKKRLV